jgi:hypothetical protein
MTTRSCPGHTCMPAQQAYHPPKSHCAPRMPPHMPGALAQVLACSAKALAQTQQHSVHGCLLIRQHHVPAPAATKQPVNARLSWLSRLTKYKQYITAGTSKPAPSVLLDGGTASAEADSPGSTGSKHSTQHVFLQHTHLKLAAHTPNGHCAHTYSSNLQHTEHWQS